MSDAHVVYRGYVDDPRNTDRAWIETTAAVKLLSSEEARAAEPKGRTDAMKAAWFWLSPHGWGICMRAMHALFAWHLPL